MAKTLLETFEELDKLYEDGFQLSIDDYDENGEPSQQVLDDAEAIARAEKSPVWNAKNGFAAANLPTDTLTSEITTRLLKLPIEELRELALKFYNFGLKNRIKGEAYLRDQISTIKRKKPATIINSIINIATLAIMFGAEVDAKEVDELLEPYYPNFAETWKEAVVKRLDSANEFRKNTRLRKLAAERDPHNIK